MTSISRRSRFPGGLGRAWPWWRFCLTRAFTAVSRLVCSETVEAGPVDIEFFSLPTNVKLRVPWILSILGHVRGGDKRQESLKYGDKIRHW